MNNKNLTYPRYFLFTLILVTLFSSHLPTASAQEPPCGSIIGPEETVEITDCSNPFDVTSEPISPYVLKINGEVVEDGGFIYQSELSVGNIFVEGEALLTTNSKKLYKYEDGDYVYIDQEAETPTQADYQAFADTYFPTQAESDFYMTIWYEAEKGSGDTDQYFYDEEWNDIIDEETGDTVNNRYYGFLWTADSYLYSLVPILGEGTYTMVIEDFLLQFSQRTFIDRVKDFLIPTAYAQAYPGPYVYTITFTIVEAPVGASSVLFLPGIMGSRLFEESGECNLFGGVDKVERWFSSFDCDMERLMMNENGESINSIFTEVEGGVIEDVGVVSNLYDSLFEDLEQWKEDGIIADYRGVPYDWRLRLSDILKTQNIGGRIVFDNSGTYKDGYIYKSLLSLKNSSPNGKVVLVGHSNGGLVIQTLLATMKDNNDPLLTAVDKVVLVAVPQAGAPESILGLLHGVDVGKGLVVSQEKSRKLMNTSPFSYHLLPTEDYYVMVETPVITFESGTSTDSWIAQFGNELDTVGEVESFMKKESGRITPAWDDTETPATTYSNLHNYAQTIHTSLNDWRPNTAVVYEVAGVGVLSPSTLEYFTDTKCIRVAQTTGAGRVCDESEPKLGYRVNKVIDGDGTVTAPSALAMQSEVGVVKLWLDLKSHNQFRFERTHKNIFEVEDIRSFVRSVAVGDVGAYTYITNESPDFDGDNRLVYQLHSPLDMYVALNDGEVVGSSTPMLRGVMYSRYGEVQHLSIPENETGYEVRLAGLAAGSFTLDIEKYTGNSLEERVTYSALPSSTSTKVIIEVAVNESLDEVGLQIDYEGDGLFETLALPGLGQVTFIETASTTIATSTPPFVIKSGRTGTRVKVPGLATPPTGVLTAAAVYTTEQQLMLRLIHILTQYRNLLVKLNVQ